MEAVVSLHLDSVYRFMRSLSGSREDAEDLTQETFLEAERSAKTFQGECGLRTWLHRIAYRRYVRWRSRHKITTPIRDAELAFSPSSDFRLDLDRALLDLTDDQRAAFVLAEIEGLDLSEVAAALGAPVGTIKSRLFRAKAALRIALSEENDAPIYR
jgi:RNA polymerase sigma-70 factor (ECF subfamily)